jgi:hypothetical protein
MSVEGVIRKAMRDRSPVSLRYETTGAARRTVHPQVLFHTANGEICLDAYQVAGPTSSGERIPTWRQMDLAKIRAPELIDGSFRRAPGLNLAADKYSAGVIAHV